MELMELLSLKSFLGSLSN